MTTTDTALRITRSRGPLIGALVTLLGLAGAAWFWVVHPQDLPVDGRERTARTPTGAPVYLGIARTDRTIHITGVRLQVEASAPVEVRLLRCVGGDVQVTTDPSAFCTDLEDPSGHALAPADSLIVEVTGEAAGAAYIRPPQISFTDGLQRGTRRAGSPAVVTIVGR